MNVYDQKINELEAEIEALKISERHPFIVSRAIKARNNAIKRLIEMKEIVRKAEEKIATARKNLENQGLLEAAESMCGMKF